MTDFLSTAIAAAKAGGDIIVDNFGQTEEHHLKDDASIFTKTDQAAEQAILAVITSTFPDHSYFSEELGASEHSAEYQWIIDPIDGTSNFVRQIPLVSVSVALTHRGAPIAGVVWAPLLDELFVAAQGSGASLNDSAITSSTTAELSSAVVGFGSRKSSDRTQVGTLFQHLLPKLGTYRVFGSFALQLCYVACGRIDTTLGLDVAWHDGAAAALIAREAGVTVTNFSGSLWQPKSSEQDSVIAANPTLHKQLLADIPR